MDELHVRMQLCVLHAYTWARRTRTKHANTFISILFLLYFLLYFSKYMGAAYYNFTQ